MDKGWRHNESHKIDATIISFTEFLAYNNKKVGAYMIVWLIGCSFWKEPPNTPTCSADRVYFSPVSIESYGREFDDGYHNDGPFVAIFDMDHDGYMDILQCFPREDTYLHSWKGRTFLFEECGSMLVADLNEDGWDDLIVASEDEEQDTNIIVVMENKEGTLHERFSFPFGDDRLQMIRGGHLNNDEYLDLLLSKNSHRQEQSDRDVIAYGTSTWDFALDEDALPDVYASRKAFDAIIMDIDQQGKGNIYTANDRGYEFGGNIFWQKEGDTWSVAADCGCMPTQDAMGVDIADYNHDGFLDIVTSDVDRTHLFEGLGDGIFVDMTQVRGANLMEPEEMSWGIRFVDLNNDGMTEIFSAQGDHTYEGLDMPEYIGSLGLSIQTFQDDTFVEVQEEFGFDMQGSFRSIVPFHWNQDGVLDYWISDAENASILMESNGCSDGNWLFVTGSTGTRIRFSAGQDQYYGEIHGASSYNASITPHIHFGLGAHQSIQNVEIRLPNSQWQLLHEDLSVPHNLVLSDR